MKYGLDDGRGGGSVSLTVMALMLFHCFLFVSSSASYPLSLTYFGSPSLGVWCCKNKETNKW